jgi:hypothetical protein
VDRGQAWNTPFVSGVITAEVISGIGWKERETIAERLELSW